MEHYETFVNAEMFLFVPYCFVEIMVGLRRMALCHLGAGGLQLDSHERIR